jgi:hypothetical protein
MVYIQKLFDLSKVYNFKTIFPGLTTFNSAGRKIRNPKKKERNKIFLQRYLIFTPESKNKTSMYTVDKSCAFMVCARLIATMRKTKTKALILG